MNGFKVNFILSSLYKTASGVMKYVDMKKKIL